ncbi:MAG: 3-hydroxyacyl-CoA dehydrogenase, partial [Burkholderiales bacterium PBB5]
MQIQGQSAIVTGGGSGLGEAVARALAAAGAKVAVLDVNAAGAQRVAADIGGIACTCDVTNSESVTAALDAATAAHGVPRIVMNIAGIGSAKRIIGKDGTPAPLEDFERVVRINLIGTYNVARLAAARIATTEPLADAFNSGERGVMVNTASVAA